MEKYTKTCMFMCFYVNFTHESMHVSMYISYFTPHYIIMVRVYYIQQIVFLNC